MPRACLDRTGIEDPERLHFMRTLQIVAGVLLIVLGIAGLILPGLQGVALIVAGVLLLAQASPLVARWLQRYETSHPAIAKFTARLRLRDGSINVTPLVIAIIAASLVWAIIAVGGYHLLFR
jgi:uncharacterized membrane protein YbaN (DUF454 family)